MWRFTCLLRTVYDFLYPFKPVPWSDASETCNASEPHLLTHVDTTNAAVHEAKCTAVIEQALVKK